METLNLFDLYAKISLDTSEYDSGVKDVEKSGSGLASKLKSGLASAGKVAAAGIGAVTAAAGAAVGGLLALEQSTEEYRIAMGRLNTAFESAGYGAEAANQAYSDFYGILGDTDRATEASQLLAKLADNEEDLAEWTNIAAGVNGTFGDSLPIESLIEAANETARTGTVVGTLADALNWAGTVGEDEFNAMLASCSNESERNQLIMETLAGTYDDAADAFYRNNEALVAARDVQTGVNNSLAQVGQSISEVKTSLLTALAPAIETLSDRFAEFISSVDTDALADGIMRFVDAIIDNGPTILSIITGIGAGFLAWKITSVVSGVITSLMGLIPALTGATAAQNGLNAAMAANPIGLVITIIASLVSALLTLWNTNEGFRDAVLSIWEAIKGFFLGAWEAIKSAWDAAGEFFSGIWESIKETFSAVADTLGGFFSDSWDAIQDVWSTVAGFFSGIWDDIKSTFSAVKETLGGFFSDAWDAVQETFAGWGEFFSGLWDDLTGVFSDAWDWFVGIGEDIVNGIWTGIENIWDGLTSWFTGLWDDLVGGVKSFLGIKSPSKVFGEIGENMALGLGKGWDNEFSRIRSDIEGGMNFGTANVDFASSGLGVASSGMVNGISSAVSPNGYGGSTTINLMLPDGTKFATWQLPFLINAGRAAGTPIANPQVG